jgi:hypothetical protein
MRQGKATKDLDLMAVQTCKATTNWSALKVSHNLILRYLRPSNASNSIRDNYVIYFLRHHLNGYKTERKPPPIALSADVNVRGVVEPKSHAQLRCFQPPYKIIAVFPNLESSISREKQSNHCQSLIFIEPFLLIYFSACFCSLLSVIQSGKHLNLLI